MIKVSTFHFQLLTLRVLSLLDRETWQEDRSGINGVEWRNPSAISADVGTLSRVNKNNSSRSRGQLLRGGGGAQAGSTEEGLGEG